MLHFLCDIPHALTTFSSRNTMLFEHQLWYISQISYIRGFLLKWDWSLLHIQMLYLPCSACWQMFKLPHRRCCCACATWLGSLKRGQVQCLTPPNMSSVLPLCFKYGCGKPTKLPFGDGLCNGDGLGMVGCSAGFYGSHGLFRGDLYRADAYSNRDFSSQTVK